MNSVPARSWKIPGLLRDVVFTSTWRGTNPAIQHPSAVINCHPERDVVLAPKHPNLDHRGRLSMHTHHHRTKRWEKV